MGKKGCIHNLEVVYKIVDTCNLACTYCYYFRGDSYQGHEHRPDYAKIETTTRLVQKLCELLQEYEVQELSLILHGGEPLMMKKSEFTAHLSIIRKALGSVPIYLQTNGVLLNEAWCQLLNNHNIRVSISLDGSQEWHDKHRITVAGHGTYHRVLKGIATARQCLTQEEVGIISVLQPDFDYQHICNHFSKTLGLNTLSLLIPDRTCEPPLSEAEVQGYSQALIDAFDFHVSDGQGQIREIASLLENFQRYNVNHHHHNAQTFYPDDRVSVSEVLTIHTNGDINYYDLVYPEVVLAQFGLVNREFNLADVNLGAMIFSDRLRAVRAQAEAVADDCQTCEYAGLCYQTAPAYRATADGYNSRSVYCQVNKTLYQYVVDWLVANGYPTELIDLALKGAPSPTAQPLDHSLTVRNAYE
ncbi:radical SAM protein [Vibrio ouci]|uniref:Radical SAM protein n=1 Tax=Vibrio ouci TaxID=2499078 RepID=A0A4Y8W9Z0_9VIBR|nr:radical SAM protein [Vibrio ouci]TFH89423.1 radical SAM protein [Vibrio ouci]